jgi:TetR/AcrR family transcriptional repressor of mexJK operon
MTSKSKATAAAARREALIAHTRMQIVRDGPHKVNLSEVLRLAGGSKATVVKYFGSREGLVAAAIDETAREALTLLRLDVRGKNLSESLSIALVGLLRFYLDPGSLTVYRAVIATGGQLAADFYYRGHELTVSELERFLLEWKGRGIRTDLDLRELAGRLTHMIRAGLYEQVLIGLVALPVHDEKIRATADQVTTLFLEGAAD